MKTSSFSPLWTTYFCYYENINGISTKINDIIPFNLPNGWCWIRLKNICNIVSAKRVLQSDWKHEGVPFYRAREIAKLAMYGYVNNELYISRKLFNENKKNGIPLAGDIMVTAVGTIGKTYIVKDTDEFYYKDASVICLENRHGVYSMWLKILFDSPFMIDQILAFSAGTTVATITIEKANEYIIPLPPYNEQKRIIEKYFQFEKMIKGEN